MRSSESITELADALVKANLLITNPTKDQTAKVKMKSGGEFSYRYVGLDKILADLRPILQTHGLVVAQEATAFGAVVAVTTRLFHSSGEWIEYAPLALPAGPDAQSAGSAITYARRYALCAALGIAADEDDDGAKAKRSPAVPATTSVRAQPAAEVAATRAGDPSPSGPVEAHTRNQSSATASTTGPGSSAPQIGHGGAERAAGGLEAVGEDASGPSAPSCIHPEASRHRKVTGVTVCLLCGTETEEVSA